MSSILKKHIFATKSIYDSTAKLDFISIGVVEAIDDVSDAGRIIVSIKGVDDKTSEANKQKSAAFPLLPKHLQVMPKVGEAVFVLKLDLGDSGYINRFWVGPIISQPQKLNNDPYFFTAKAALPSGQIELETAPSLITEANGVFPDKAYISIQGRNNSDIIFKDNEVLIRAGQHKINKPLVFNDKNIGYFQIKHNVAIEMTSSDGIKKINNYTVTNIVAEKIHLLTHNGTKNFNLKNNINLISDDEMSRIANEAHPLPYGDILLDFLKAAKAYILGHVHPYDGLKPVADPAVSDNFINFDLTRINAKNIKID